MDLGNLGETLGTFGKVEFQIDHRQTLGLVELSLQLKSDYIFYIKVWNLNKSLSIEWDWIVSSVDQYRIVERTQLVKLNIKGH